MWGIFDAGPPWYLLRAPARGRTRRWIAAFAILAAMGLMPAAASADETFIVDTTADGIDDNPGDGICRTGPAGPCTLRAAVMEANGPYSASETITIELGPGVHLLTRPDDGTGAQTHGDLNLIANAAVVIEGAGPHETVIRQTEPSRVIAQSASTGLTVRELTLTGGAPDGDTDGSGGGNGGAISSVSPLTLDHVLITGNVAGPTTGLESITGSGGGVYTSGALTMLRSTVALNQAQNAGGLDLPGSLLKTIENSLIAGNEAVGRTGGLDVGAEALIQDVAIRDNVADTGSGGVELGRFQTQTLRRVEITGNRGGAGGLGTGGLARIWNATISGNEATDANGFLGAGVHLYSPYDGDVELYNVTLTANTGAMANAVAAANPTEVVSDPPDARLSILDGDCTVTLVAPRGNVESGDTCLPTPLVNGNVQADPELGPLADNGGRTLTHLPAPTSPAVNIHSRHFGEDQRNANRPPVQSDAGAVELGATVPDPPPGPPSADNTAPALRILGRRLVLQPSRVMRVRLRCPAAEASPPCRGRLRVITRKRIAFGGARRTVTLVAKRYRVGAGQHRALRLRLSKPQARLVRNRPEARQVRAITRVSDAADNSRRVAKPMQVKPR